MDFRNKIWKASDEFKGVCADTEWPLFKNYQLQMQIITISVASTLEQGSKSHKYVRK